ncbi:MAG: serine protease [Pirellulales bacterium]
MSRLLLLLASFWLGDPAPHHETATTSVIATVSYEQQGARLAAVRVKNWASGYLTEGPSVSGTGTLTAVQGDQGLVLTAGHLFEGKVGTITVEFTNGQRSGARLLAVDTKLDVAALWIFAPDGIQPLPLADRDPILGQQVEIWGYGPKRFRSFLARVARPIPMDGDVPHTLVAAQGVEDRQVTIPGDSGGAMVVDGQIVAVHWGYRGSQDDPRRCVHALGCSTLKEWLRSELDPSIWQNAAFRQN